MSNIKIDQTNVVWDEMRKDVILYVIKRPSGLYFACKDFAFGLYAFDAADEMEEISYECDTSAFSQQSIQGFDEKTLEFILSNDKRVGLVIQTDHPISLCFCFH